MADLEQRIDALLEATENWLNKDNDYLSVAYDQTVREDYFSFEDVKHALLSIKNAVNESSIRGWVDRAELSDESDASGNNVLCLHAGNIPLVGFQNALATILSGATYYGKISRKDPYLLPTFLNEVKKTDAFSSVDLQWVHNLEHFEGLKSDAVLFAGSERSVPGVKHSIQKYNIANRNTKYLIRTAHFSMACLDDPSPETINNLVEGIFRYGGKGCRSVALVVAPFGLDEISNELEESVHSFWEESPQHKKPGPKLKHRQAYNKAVEQTQLWLEDFLIQEGGLEFDQDFICYWIEGDKHQAAELAEQFGEQHQSIYITNPDTKIPGFGDRTEHLENAQQPPINWKPDGVDTIEWLINC
ncbi:MAG: acyl-CoA reductase [Balneolaceae bacterium]|nr:acyl-CoA reductase [Balneolaceae bacterium]